MDPVVVDDRDPQIDYLTSWYKDPGQGADFDQTISTSDNPNAAFQFKFTGTSVSVYGSIPTNNTAVTTYTIDLEAPVSFTNTPSSSYLSRQLCFQSHNLADGPHTLIVTVPNSVIGLPWTSFHFDYLTYVPSGADTATTTTVQPQPVLSSSSQPKPTSTTPSQTSKTAVTSLTPNSLAVGSFLSATSSAGSSSALTTASSQVSSPPSNTSLSRATMPVSPAASSSSTPFPATTTPSGATATVTVSAPSPGSAGDITHESSASSTGANLHVILPAVLVPLLLILALLGVALCVRRRHLRVRARQRPTPYDPAQTGQYTTSSTSLVRAQDAHSPVAYVPPIRLSLPHVAAAAAYPASTAGADTPSTPSTRYCGTHIPGSYGEKRVGTGWRGSGMGFESVVPEDAPPSYYSALG